MCKTPKNQFYFESKLKCFFKKVLSPFKLFSEAKLNTILEFKMPQNFFGLRIILVTESDYT